MDNTKTEHLTVALSELAGILSYRVKENSRLYQEALGSCASIMPHEFKALIDTYEAISQRMADAVETLSEVDSMDKSTLNKIMTMKLPTPLNIKLETYAEVNAFRGALGMGLAQLGMSISIQLPLMGHLIDLAEIQSKHTEQSNGISTTPPRTPEARLEVNDDVGPGPDTGEAGGRESGAGPAGAA